MKFTVFSLLIFTCCTYCSDGNIPLNSGVVKEADTSALSAPRNTIVAQEQEIENVDISGVSETLRAYIDPETGEFITTHERKTPVAKEMALPALSTSQEGIEERRSPVPGGGTMVDLKGRFQNPLTATLDENGKTKIWHQANE